MKNKEERGITLIALVITIIVLLILAGISIATLTGQNGILTQAKNAKEQTRIEQVKEQINLWNTEKQMSKQTNQTATSEEDFLQGLIDNGSITENEIDREKQVITVEGEEIYYGSGSELTDIYVALYTDGTLVFNNKDEFNEELVAKKYQNIKGLETSEDIPWKADSESITTVDFLGKIVPNSTHNWFYHLQKLTTINNINNLDTSRVTNMSYMFYACFDLKTVDLSNFNTENVTDMSYMFSNCSEITNLNFSSFDTRKVKNMESMFIYCSELTELDLSSFNTEKVTNMASMFQGDRNLTTLNVSSFDTSIVTIMEQMFTNCDKLTELDLRNFNTNKVEYYDYMFGWKNEFMPNTVKIYIGPNWKSEMTEEATCYAGKFQTNNQNNENT